MKGFEGSMGGWVVTMYLWQRGYISFEMWWWICCVIFDGEEVEGPCCIMIPFDANFSLFTTLCANVLLRRTQVT